jgi:hypothetical protein
VVAPLLTAVEVEEDTMLVIIICTHNIRVSNHGTLRQTPAGSDREKVATMNPAALRHSTRKV